MGRVEVLSERQRETMTKKNSRVHRESLPARLAGALLNVPFEAEEASQPESHPSVGQRLAAARAELAEAVVAANQVLAANPLMEIIAEHAARQAGRRGTPIVVVDTSGEVMLEVHYLAAGEPLPVVPLSTVPAPSTAAPTEPRKSRLPPISELRAEAETLKIDHSQFGKNKKKLMAVIAAAKKDTRPCPVCKTSAWHVEEDDAYGDANASPKDTITLSCRCSMLRSEWLAGVKKTKPAAAPKPKMTRTAPSVSPVRVVKLDDRKIIPMGDDDDDLSSLFEPKVAKPKPQAPAAPPKKSPKVRPPRRGTPKAQGPAPKLSGRSLSSIASAAEAEVDIDAILANPTPPIPEEDS